MKRLSTSDRHFRSKIKQAVRGGRQDDDTRDVVESIIEQVQAHGDIAVVQMTERFDGARLKPGQMRIPESKLEAAAEKLDAEDRDAIENAIESVRAFHTKTLPKKWRGKNTHGATVGENFYPIQRVGLYVPGGQVPLVSSVIMTAIPAAVANVPEVVVCTPPRKNGSVDQNLLAALHLCGVREVYRVGGVQAICAMALGTRAIRPVDKILGPGNAYVIEAKRQLYGHVGIDLLPGPSEVMVLGDESADPERMAAELLAQAEHGSGKEKVYLAVLDEAQIDAVEAAVEVQIKDLKHARAIRQVMHRALAVVAESVDELIDLANRIAPEHLQLMLKTNRLEKAAEQITTAGAILMGHETPTALGDFVAGPSHTLPTNGTGRFSSGLRIDDFMRRTSIVKYTKASLKKAVAPVRAFSRMEQLDAHGQSVEVRLPK